MDPGRQAFARTPDDGDGIGGGAEQLGPGRADPIEDLGLLFIAEVEVPVLRRPLHEGVHRLDRRDRHQAEGGLVEIRTSLEGGVGVAGNE